VPKGYVYSAMMFSIFIECINMVHRRRQRPVHLRNPYGPEHPEAAVEGNSARVAGTAGL
jgi:hypothetical protein